MPEDSYPIVLLVEDSPFDAELTRHQLRHQPVRVEVARDGVEALDYLFRTGARSNRDPAADPDLVLTDLRLPRIDGREVIARLKADPRTRHIPVIVLTGSEDDAGLRAALDAGADGHLSKPLDKVRFAAIARAFGLRGWKEAPPGGGEPGDDDPASGKRFHLLSRPR